MRRAAFATACVVILAVALILGTLGAQAQRQEDTRRRGMMGGARMACNIEGLWSQLTFTGKLPGDRLMQVRPRFQKAWDEREQVSAGVTTREDMVEGYGKLDTAYSALLDAVKKELTEEELAKLQPWIDDQNRLMEVRRERLERIAEIMQQRAGGQEQ